ncbi:DUF957 domain-containing protein [Escherichia coli]|nr:DUF957 domain-containing protein [Escherichia coli]
MSDTLPGTTLPDDNKDRPWWGLPCTVTPCFGARLVDILIAWLQDNIDCESGIIFDNDEDKTDSAALLPCIEQAREDIRTLRQQQLLQQNR